MLSLVRLRALHAFILVAELKSFRKAAAHLHTTQPAVSARIRGLEDHYRRKLIHRGARGIRLTTEGLEVLRHAKPIVELTERLNGLFGPASAISGRIRIGAIDTISASWLLPLFDRLRLEYPELDFELRADTSIRLIDDLREGEVDIALLMGPVDDEGVVNVELGNFPMAWVANPAKFHFDGEIDVLELRRHPILSYPRGSKPYRMVEQLLGAETDPALRLNCSNSLFTLVRLVTDGFGVAAIPPAIIDREIREGVLAVIPVRQPFPGLACHAAYHAASHAAAPGVIAEAAREEADRFWRERTSS